MKNLFKKNNDTKNFVLTDKTDNKDVEECCICLDNEFEFIETACGHHICTECSVKYFKISGKCPLCRFQLRPNPTKRSINENIQLIIQETIVIRERLERAMNNLNEFVNDKISNIYDIFTNQADNRYYIHFKNNVITDISDDFKYRRRLLPYNPDDLSFTLDDISNVIGRTIKRKIDDRITKLFPIIYKNKIKNIIIEKLNFPDSNANDILNYSNISKIGMNIIVADRKIQDDIKIEKTKKFIEKKNKREIKYKALYFKFIEEKNENKEIEIMQSEDKYIYMKNLTIDELSIKEIHSMKRELNDMATNDFDINYIIKEIEIQNKILFENKKIREAKQKEKEAKRKNKSFNEYDNSSYINEKNFIKSKKKFDIVDKDEKYKIIERKNNGIQQKLQKEQEKINKKIMKNS